MKEKAEHIYNDYDENQVAQELNKRKKAKRRKRRRIAFCIIVVLLIAGFFISDLSRIQSITVKGNEMVKKETIIDNLSYKAHKSISIFSSTGSIKEEIEKMPFIKKAEVSKSLFGSVSVTVQETQIYGYTNINNTVYIFDSKGTIYKDSKKEYSNYCSSAPLLNNFNDKQLKEFVKEYIKIPSLVRNDISDINFAPMTGDNDRCEFKMTNGKILYVRISQMAKQLQKDNYATKMAQYPNYKYYDFVGKYMYASN